jgi:hypothetical protein
MLQVELILDMVEAYFIYCLSLEPMYLNTRTNKSACEGFFICHQGLLEHEK